MEIKEMNNAEKTTDSKDMDSQTSDVKFHNIQTNGIQQNGGLDTEKQTLKSKILRSVHIVAGVAQACFFIYNSLMPYIFKKYGIDTAQFGYIQSGLALAQLFCAPLIGRFGDKYGARAVLLLAVMSAATGHLIMGLAWGLPLIILSRISLIAQDTKLGGQMIVSDLVPGKERGVAMGKLMFPMSIGMFVGPALGGQLAKYLGTQNAYLLTWLGPVCCAILLLYTVPASTRPENASEQKKGGPPKKNIFALIRQPGIPFLLLVRILAVVPFMTLAQNIGVIGMTVFKLTPPINGLLMSYFGVLGIVNNSYLLGKLSKRYNEDQLLTYASLAMVVAYALFSQVSSIWGFPFLLFPWSLGSAILENQIIARLTKMVPSSDTGVIVGVNQAAFQLARILAPLLGGYFIQNFGFQAIGYFGLAVSCVLWFITSGNAKKQGNEKKDL